MEIIDNFLWVEKYRPQCIDDIILPDRFKKIFKKFIAENNIPNLLLVGPPGVGKTTIAKAILKELDCDYIIKNGSLDLNKDLLRNDISLFASSVSFTNKRKYVIVDEADNLREDILKALRNFTEEFSKNCGFILTGNFKDKFPDYIQSRFSEINFNLKKDEYNKLQPKIFKRIKQILNNENVEFDKEVIAQLIQQFSPDWRRIINELQKYAGNGSIDSGILSTLNNSSVDHLIELLKDRNFTQVRTWIGENIESDPKQMFKEFYQRSSNLFEVSFVPELILLIAKYQFQAAHSIDQEINLSAFFVEVMSEARWK